MKSFGRKRFLILILSSTSVLAATLPVARRLANRSRAQTTVGAQEKQTSSFKSSIGETNYKSGSAVAGPLAGPILIDRSVIAGGGGTSDGSNAGKTFSLYGTIGQGFAAANTGTTGQNTQSGGQFAINGGYVSTLAGTAGVAPTEPTFQFDADFYTVVEGVRVATVNVLRLGPSNATARVELVSSDASARQKGDYTLVVADLVFAPNETVKTIQVLVNDDSYTEGSEFATLLLQHPLNGVLGTPSTVPVQITDNSPETSGNPIDDSRTFVGTHYHDFLYRQSDQAGEDFWTQQIEMCGSDTSCRAARRVSVSTAFFVSIEFQQTGYLVVRAYKAAFGNLKTNPRYVRFLKDQRSISAGVIVGSPGWEQKLIDNRRTYLENFVSRAEYLAQFPQGQAAGNYVDQLFQNAGASPTTAERNAAISAYGAGDTVGRAASLLSVLDSGSVFNQLYNDGFVLSQYFGYLRRNPDDEPDFNFAGYDFWLTKLNQLSLPGEDMRDPAQALSRINRAEMVRAFIQSFEYRQRFGDAPSGNQTGAPVPAVPEK